jgi:hypothetical protein
VAPAYPRRLRRRAYAATLGRVSSITAARTDPWRCAACGSRADLAPLSAEVGLVRLAAGGEDGFRLGSEGIEDRVSPLLEPCSCGGRLEPGTGAGEAIVARFQPDALRPVAAKGWQALESSSDPRLREIAGVWRPRALRALGREDELTAEDQLELRLEGRLEELLLAIERAEAAGDVDAAEAAHARYVELGTTYVQKFVRGRERTAEHG